MKRVRFGMVLTDREKRALARLAEAEGGLSEAAMLRRLIRKTARECGLWLDTDTPTLDTSTAQQSEVARVSG